MKYQINFLPVPEYQNKFLFQVVNKFTPRLIVLCLFLQLISSATTYFRIIMLNKVNNTNIHLQKKAAGMIDFTQEDINLLSEAQKKISTLQKIYSQKPRYSQLLTHLDDITPAGISYEDISIRPNLEFTLQGKSIAALPINQLFQKLKEKWFYDLSLPNIQINQSDNKYSFSIRGKVKQDFLEYNSNAESNG